MVKDYDGWRWLNADPHADPRPARRAATRPHRRTDARDVGERDIADAHGMAEDLGREIAGARKVILPDVGHMANMEAPERFNDVL